MQHATLPEGAPEHGHCLYRCDALVCSPRSAAALNSCLLPLQSTYTHWQDEKPSDTTKQCVASQWHDTPVTGGTLYAYGATTSQTSNLSAIAGGWKEVDCASFKAMYFCRSVSESRAGSRCIFICNRLEP